MNGNFKEKIRRYFTELGTEVRGGRVNPRLISPGIRLFIGKEELIVRFEGTQVFKLSTLDALVKYLLSVQNSAKEERNEEV